MGQLIQQQFRTQDGREKGILQTNGDLSGDKKAFITTCTQEPFMPVRLYFKFLHKKKLVKALDRLKCIHWENADQFVVSYWEEAKNFDLSVQYDEVPEEIFPMLLASGRIINSSEVYLDVRSFKRAKELIDFINKRVGPQFLYITHVATYNRFMSADLENAQDILSLDFDRLFSEENLQAAYDEEESRHSRSIPVVKKIAISGTKGELNRLKLIMGIHMQTAQEFWNGNTTCSPGEIIHKMISTIHGSP